MGHRGLSHGISISLSMASQLRMIFSERMQWLTRTIDRWTATIALPWGRHLVDRRSGIPGLVGAPGGWGTGAGVTVVHAKLFRSIAAKGNRSCFKAISIVFIVLCCCILLFIMYLFLSLFLFYYILILLFQVYIADNSARNKSYYYYYNC